MKRKSEIRPIRSVHSSGLKRKTTDSHAGDFIPQCPTHYKTEDIFCNEREVCEDLSINPSRSTFSFGTRKDKVQVTIIMAFCNKLGNLLRQGAAQSRQESMLNYIRCMSSSKLFVGGLSYGVDDQSLKDAFASFGDVVEARVITDRDTGRSRGFGFVNFTNDEAASSALSAMDGQDLNGRNIRVTYANERPPGPRSPGGGYGGSGGYGGGYRRGGGGGGFGDPVY